MPTKAQQSGCATISPNCVQVGTFLPSGIASIVASSVSSNVAFPSAGSSLLAVISNQGPVQVNVQSGNSSITVTPTTGTPLAPGHSVCVAQGLSTNLAVVTGSQAAVIEVQSGSGACPVAGLPTSGAGMVPELTTHTSVASASLVAKASAGSVSSWSVVNGNTQGFLLLLDAATLPANGVVGANVIKCKPVTAGALLAESAPQSFVSGLVLAFSTTGCFNLTIQTGLGNLGYLSAQVR